MIVVSPRAMAAIAQAYRALHECGRSDEAEELIASFRDVPMSAPVEPSDPPKRSKVRTEEDREKERVRKARSRMSQGMSRDVTGVTNGVTSSVTFRDASRDGARLPEEEEKRKVSDFRAVVSEIEVVEKSESSELRARPSVTSGVTERDVTRDIERDVTRRDALRVQRKFADALSVTWDTHSWLSELQRIATKPEPELARVLENLKADPWVRDNRGVVTPGHLLKHWDRYVQPPKGKVAKPVDETPVIRRYVNNDADAQMMRDLAADRARMLKGAANG